MPYRMSSKTVKALQKKRQSNDHMNFTSRQPSFSTLQPAQQTKRFVLRIGALPSCNCLLLFCLIIGVCACSRSENINQYMNQRHFIVYASDVSLPPPDSSQIKPEIQEIDGVPTKLSRFLFAPGDIERSAGMAQQFDTNFDTRLLGLEFHIRSLSGPTTLIPVIISTSPTYSNYVMKENIVLDGNKWQKVSLTFREFADTRSRMHLDIDSLFSGHHKTIKLYLIPGETDGTDKVIEWGPVSGIYDKKRYRFY